MSTPAVEAHGLPKAGLPVDPPVAHFTPVTLANGVSLDFDHYDHVDEHHHVFQLSDEEFRATPVSPEPA